MVKLFAAKYFKQLKKTLDLIDIVILEKITKTLLEAYENKKMIFVFGNGGSGATASHFAGDFNKGISYNLKKKFKILCLNDNIPTMLALSNDCSFENVFLEQLKNFLKPKDIVIAISGSGNSKNVLNAITYANKNKAISIGLTGFKGGKLKELAQLCLLAPIEDMEKTEDIHLIVVHLLKQFLITKLHHE